MDKKANKLTLNQETLRNLTEAEFKNFAFTKNSCIRSVCGLACTPAAGVN